MSILIFSTLLLLGAFENAQSAPADDCDTPSVTTFSGTHALRAGGKLCAGQLIFDEEFTTFDQSKWHHEATRGGASNGEFQWYVNDRAISFVRDGIFYIKPTANAADNAVHSAKVNTAGSFAYKYGKLEVKGEAPVGDWLWPAFWHMPQASVYGGWPTSGEIDLMESYGNVAIQGPNKLLQTLHWGPSPSQNRFTLTAWSKTDGAGYQNAFHLWQMEWTQDHLKMSVDGTQTGILEPPAGGMWAKGGFSGTNPWAKGTKMAPFDQEFFLIINNAVGGTVGYFSDGIAGKPWRNGDGYASGSQKFWAARNQWLPTWKLEGDGAAIKVDYVKIWAV